MKINEGGGKKVVDQMREPKEGSLERNFWKKDMLCRMSFYSM